MRAGGRLLHKTVVLTVADFFIILPEIKHHHDEDQAYHVHARSFLTHDDKKRIIVFCNNRSICG